MHQRAPRIRARGLAVTLSVLLAALALAACGEDSDDAPAADSKPTLTIGAIPDQDPQELPQRLYGKVAKYLSSTLDVKVKYQPVTDYAAAVTAVKVGDIDPAWFGGLRSLQAQMQLKGATAVAQRDIDAQSSTRSLSQGRTRASSRSPASRA